MSLSKSNTITNKVSQIALDLLEIEKMDAHLDSSHVSNSSKTVFTDVETAILRSIEPIEINETEEIRIGDEKGIWANKSEVLSWRGERPISDYAINVDPNPEIIKKKSKHNLKYVQELAVRYLRPPTPPLPGEIIIQQLSNVVAPPAPPLVIRQQPPRPRTPEPLVIREAPPKPPAPVGRKIITISGNKKPIPPPRKVIIERLAPLPSKPQSIIIERWLPYQAVKRRVILQKANGEPILMKPKNIIIQWEPPQVVVAKEFRFLGVGRANPVDYVNRYGGTLLSYLDLPSFVKEIKPPDNIIQAADHKSNMPYELEGDVHALNLVDLEKEGLLEYKKILTASFESSQGTTYESNTENYLSHESSTSSATKLKPEPHVIDKLVEQIFEIVDSKKLGKISVEDAQQTLLRINSRMSKQFDNTDVRELFSSLSINDDNTIDLGEFKKAFLKISDNESSD